MLMFSSLYCGTTCNFLELGQNEVVKRVEKSDLSITDSNFISPSNIHKTAVIKKNVHMMETFKKCEESAWLK